MNNVVDDIYEALTPLTKGKHLDISDKEIEEFGERMKLALKGWAKPPRRDSAFSLRMSNIGKPIRRLWFDKHHKTKESIQHPKTFIKFLYGHLLEELLLLLVKASGHKVTDEQKEVEVDGIKGHMDCKINGEVIDIKTASNFAFKKFSEGTLAQNDTFGYMAQLAGYEAAEGTSDGGFLAINKESGELALFRPGNLSKPNPVNKINNLKQALDLDTPPEKCYTPIPEGKKGNEILPPSCVYCSFKNECWSDANNGHGLRVFKYAHGLRYFTKVVSQPKVLELT